MRMQKIKKNYKILIYGFLIAGVVGYTFMYGVQSGMHQMMPVGSGRETMSIGIAISDLEHGLKGYRGYHKIFSTLVEHGMANDPEHLKKYGMTAEEALTNPALLNNALTMAVNVDDITASGRYSLVREDKGLAGYYKLAFRIFGYKIESFFYLYFLLFAISVLIFFMTFYRRLDLLNILLLFACSHFVIVTTAPVVGMELQTVHNARFLPVLGLMPALYLALLILKKHSLTAVTLIGACVQVFILMLAIHVRRGTIYQLLFLSTVFGLAILWHWRRNPLLGRYAFNKINFWPLALVFVGFFILSTHLAYSLHHSYAPGSVYHYFWHPTYQGLGAHPDSMRRYGIEYVDAISQKIVEERARAQYGDHVVIEYKLYDAIFKEEFFKMLKRDPRFVIESYLYKFPLFVRNYFSSSFGAIFYLFNCGIMATVIIGSLLSGKTFLKQWFFYFCLLLLALLFSLMPAIFVIPQPHLIADPATLFTLFLYMLLAGAACFMMKRYV